MGLTRFPNGVSSFGIPVLGNDGIIPSTSGSYFWVDSNSTATGSALGTYEAPYLTLMAAYGACTASKYDVIIVKPGHSETFSTNTAATLNKIGVSIIGLGQGGGRPTFTLTGTTAAVTVAISAANQLLRNLIFTSGVAELTSAITVSAAGVTLDMLDYRESNSSYTCLSVVTGTAAADYLTISNCTFKSVTTTTGVPPCISGVAGMNDVKIINNHIEWIGVGDAATTCAIYNSGAGLRWLIHGNFIKVTGGTSATGINVASCTGLATYNNVATTKTAVAGSIDLSAMYGCQNFALNTVNKNGLLEPGVDT